jgi:4-amino-4-deoxy-L-arabinose transferase-like glycosyltransferase
MRKNKLLIITLLGVFLISIAHSFYFKIDPIVDARAYDSIGWEIKETGQYPDQAIGRPGPGFEYFLAGIYSIFGRNYPAVWVIHAILLSLSAFFVFLTTIEIFKERWHPFIGIAAAGFLGFSPDLVTISSMLMTETLLIFFLTASVFFFFRYSNNEKKWQLLVLSAILMALAALVRGNMVFLFLGGAGILLWNKKWVQASLFAGVFILTIAPWTIHNFYSFGIIKPFNGSTGILYVGNHKGATGELVINYPLPEGYGDFKTMSQLESDNALEAAGKDYIVSHPLDFIRLTLLRLSIYFSAARPFAFWPHLAGGGQIVMIILSSLYAAVILWFGALGGVAAYMHEPQKRKTIVAFFLMALAMPLSMAALIVETRYRFPIYPFLSIGAAYGLYYVIKNRHAFLSSIKKPLIFLSILFLGNTIFDISRNIQRIFERI